MPIDPLVLPARERAEYPETRAITLGLTQAVAGGPVTVSYQLGYVRPTDRGYEDAPADTQVGGNEQLSLATILADDELRLVLGLVNKRVLAIAVKQGRVPGTLP